MTLKTINYQLEARKLFSLKLRSDCMSTLYSSTQRYTVNILKNNNNTCKFISFYFRLTISSDPHFKTSDLTYNLTDTKYELGMDKLEAGKIYYVGVALVDEGKYVSRWAGPIPLESPVPSKDMIGKHLTQGSYGMKLGCNEHLLSSFVCS